MPSFAVDPETLASTAGALTPMRARLAEAEAELLSAVAMPGDATVQQTIDRYLDQVVDTMRAIAEEARTQAFALRNTAQHASAIERHTADEASAEVLDHRRSR